MADLVGQIVADRYLVKRLVGQGNTGRVYDARDSARGGRVAIRLLEPECDRHQTAFNQNEARIVGRLGNPHLTEFSKVEVLPSGERCIVSQFIQGETLRRKMDQLGRMTPHGVKEVLRQTLDGLALAHASGVVHRDLTPRSFFVVHGTQGTPELVKLIDFGLSRLDLLRAASESGSTALNDDRDSFQYLSPEQLEGKPVDPRSNIYSLGVIAYEAITGRLPFQGNDFAALVSAILSQDPIPIEELAPAASDPLLELIRKAMARSPSGRFQSTSDLLAAVSAVSHAALDASPEHGLEVALFISSERDQLPPTPPLQQNADPGIDSTRFRSRQSTAPGLQPESPLSRSVPPTSIELRQALEGNSTRQPEPKPSTEALTVAASAPPEAKPPDPPLAPLVPVSPPKADPTVAPAPRAAPTPEPQHVSSAPPYPAEAASPDLYQDPQLRAAGSRSRKLLVFAILLGLVIGVVIVWLSARPATKDGRGPEQAEGSSAPGSPQGAPSSLGDAVGADSQESASPPVPASATGAHRSVDAVLPPSTQQKPTRRTTAPAAKTPSNTSPTSKRPTSAKRSSGQDPYNYR